MATSKTLTPTNQAITLAAFTEKPDNRVNVTNDDRLADAVNALNSNMATHSFGDKTVSDLEAALDTLCSSMADGAYKHVWVHITTATGVFAATNYTGFVECNLSGARWRVMLSEQASYKTIVGWKTSSGWNWDSYALYSNFNQYVDSGIKCVYGKGIVFRTNTTYTAELTKDRTYVMMVTNGNKNGLYVLSVISNIVYSSKIGGDDMMTQGTAASDRKLNFTVNNDYSLAQVWGV